MSEKVTEIPKKLLYLCLACRHRWAGTKAVCPNCKSHTVVRDELHVLPESHGLYACRCDNAHFKIGKHPRHGIYFKCVQCGQNTKPEDVGLRT